VQAAITHSITWQQLGHRLQLLPAQQWWRVWLPKLKNIALIPASFSKKTGICCGLLAIGIMLGVGWAMVNSFTKYFNSSRSLQLSEGSKIDSLKAKSCQDKIKYRSLSSNTQTIMQVINNRKSSVKVYWINYQGENQHYFDLSPGKQRTQKTFVGHPWLITNKKESHDCLGIFFPTSNSKPIVLE
jgi:VHL beta domain